MKSVSFAAVGIKVSFLIKILQFTPITVEHERQATDIYLIPPLKPGAASASVREFDLYSSSPTSPHSFIAERTLIKRTTAFSLT
jgi:hypothetical protein